MSAERAALAQNSRPTILLVDEQREVRLLLYRILENAGYAVLAACSTADALLICDRYRGPLHLLITEIELPGASGVELAEHFQQRYPNVPVLFVSASANPQEVQACLAQPLRSVLTKPFDTRVLLNTVQDAVFLQNPTPQDSQQPPFTFV